MTILAQARSQLFLHFCEHFPAEGFRFLKRQEIFWQPTANGKQIIRFNIASYPGKYFAVMVNIGIRHDQLQNITEQVGQFRIPSPDNKYIHTLGGELGNISRGGVYRWEIDDPLQVAPAIEEIMSLYHEIAPTFYRRFDTLEAIYTCVKAQSTRENLILSHTPDVNACLALVAAHLLKRNDELQPIYNEAFQLYGKSRQFNKETVNRVYAWVLENRS